MRPRAGRRARWRSAGPRPQVLPCAERAHRPQRTGSCQYCWPGAHRHGLCPLTKAGAANLSSVQIHALDSSSGEIDLLEMLRLLQAQYGIRSILHEGGPSLFGELWAAQAVDELFLTLSPPDAGRMPDAMRPALVKERSLCPSVLDGLAAQRQAKRGHHLYLRYRQTGTTVESGERGLAIG